MGYFESLEKETKRAYDVAREARKRGLDIETEPEIPLAKTLQNVLKVSWSSRNSNTHQRTRREMSRESSFHVAKEIVTSDQVTKADPQKISIKLWSRADQAIRTALSILTEGVVAAPLEGIIELQLKETSTKHGIWQFIYRTYS